MTDAPLTVLNAAILFTDGLIVTMPRPRRHGALVNRTWTTRGQGVHGFLLSDGSFADRHRAYAVAEAAGQIAYPAADGLAVKPHTLFSSNLWIEEELDPGYETKFTS